MIRSGSTTAEAAAARTSGAADCRRSSTSARRRAEPAAGSVAPVAACRSEAAVVARLCCSTWSEGGASGATSRSGLRTAAALPISASFSFCWPGTKLFSVTVRSTSGKASRRRTRGSDAASDGTRMLIASAVQSGSDARACRVAIDSTLELLRLRGSKSKRTSGSNAHETIAATSAAARTPRRCRMHEGIDRRQHREADLGHPTGRRAQQNQKRRQQHDAQDEGDDHAETGDRPEFGHTDIAGRQKSEEARADGGGRQRQCPSDGRAGRGQRRPEVRLDEALGQAADAELNAEVDAESDEQRDEGDRDEVEAGRRQQTDGGGEDQADQRGDEDRHHDARRTHRQPQDPQERGKHRAEEQVRILGQRREFLVRQRHRTGQAHGHAMRRIQAERAGGRADGLARRRPGLQRRIVHHRLNQHDVPRVAWLCGRLCDQRAPRKEGRLAGQRFFKRLRERRHRGFDVLERALSALDPFQHVGDGGQDAAQAGIGGERGKQGLRPHEPCRGCRDFIQRQQQQPVAIEERAAVGASHAVEKFGLCLQRRCRVVWPRHRPVRGSRRRPRPWSDC